jgi:polysaccharide biosynthesis transport protein
VHHNLVETQGRTVTDQQISELNSRLVQAQADRAQAEAKLENLERDPTTVQDVINSPLIQSLKGQEIQVLRKRSELSNRYGVKHPKMINVQTELEDLRVKIEGEVKRITESLKNEVYVSRSKEESIQKSLKSLQGDAALSDKAQVELAELTRQMEADKAIYESFLTRFKETSEQGLEQADVKVVSYAEAPPTPSYPKKLMILLVAAVGSLFLGVILSLVIESVDHTFRGAPQIEQDLGINVLGMVPKVDIEDDYPIDIQPSTLIFESLRTVLNSIYFLRPNSIPKSIMVTSSIPGEGKTFFALSFANILAMSGMRVLVIDGDLKRANLSHHYYKTKQVKRKNIGVLSDFITGKAELKDIIINTSENQDIILSTANTAFSQNLLESERMSYLIKVLSLQYDFIIVDCPPVMAVSDALIVSKLVDATVYVVRWGSTDRKLVRNGLNLYRRTSGYLSGIVLSQVDLKKHKYYRYGDSASYYSSYKEYYTNESA